MNITEIMDRLPHRYPFLMVDRILEIEPGKKAVAIKNVTINEPFFQGHFPGKPIMPGVLILEALAQTAGTIVIGNKENSGKTGVLTAIDKCRIRRPVIPGDQLKLSAEIIKIHDPLVKAHGTAYVDDKIVAEADLMFALTDKV